MSTFLIIILLCGVLFSIVVLWLLFAPIVLNINSARAVYMLSLFGLIRIAVVPADNTLLITISFLFLKKSFDVIELAAAPKKEKKKKKKKKKKKLSLQKTLSKHSGSIKRIPGAAVKLLKTFEIRQLYVAVDTGNYPLNAKLFSLYGLQQHNIIFEINFINHNMIILDIRNRLIRIVPILLSLAWMFIFNKQEANHGI